MSSGCVSDQLHVDRILHGDHTVRLSEVSPEAFHDTRMLIFWRRNLYRHALLCPLLFFVVHTFIPIGRYNISRRWQTSLDSDQSSTCFRSRRYLRGYLLQSLNRISPRSELWGIDQRSTSFWFGASPLFTYSNKCKPCSSIMILFSGITSPRCTFTSEANQCRRLRHAHLSRTSYGISSITSSAKPS